MSTRSKSERKKLTTKFCQHPPGPGRYLDYTGPCPGLYFEVGANGKSGSWLLLFHIHGRRREMGLGTFPEVSLAQARADGGVARASVKAGINPIEQRRNKRDQARLAEAKNMTFLAVAKNFFDVKDRGPRPWWCEEYAQHARHILYNKFKPLHQLPINSAEAAEVITLTLYEMLMATVTHRIHKDRTGPRWLVTPDMARRMKHVAYGICERAHALKVLPITVANPAGPPLDALLTERQPKGGHLAALPYNQIPTLFAQLVAASQPAHDYFVLSEARRAIAKPYSFIRAAIKTGELPATQGEPSLPAQIAAKLFPYEWRIQPADLYAFQPMVIDVIPGVRPVIFDLIMYCALTGPRPSEAREMEWSQYDPDERLWIKPWQEIKEGEHIEQDMVIPLSDPANAIIMKMKDIQARYRMPTKYVFANYPSRFNGSAPIGQPPSGGTALNNLHKILTRQVRATMHAFRTNIRSWGEDQRFPDGTRRFDEKDLERAIGHIAGFGKTAVARIYSRQSSDIIPLIPIFDGWGKYITSGGKLGEIIYGTPFRQRP